MTLSPYFALALIQINMYTYIGTNMYTYIYRYAYRYVGTSQVAQAVERLLTVRETQIWSLDWEDPLEKEMATHSSTLA